MVTCSFFIATVYEVCFTQKGGNAYEEETIRQGTEGTAGRRYDATGNGSQGNV